MLLQEFRRNVLERFIPSFSEKIWNDGWMHSVRSVWSLYALKRYGYECAEVPAHFWMLGRRFSTLRFCFHGSMPVAFNSQSYESWSASFSTGSQARCKCWERVPKHFQSRPMKRSLRGDTFHQRMTGKDISGCSAWDEEQKDETIMFHTEEHYSWPHAPVAHLVWSRRRSRINT